jgi:hypothetical protein
VAVLKVECRWETGGVNMAVNIAVTIAVSPLSSREEVTNVAVEKVKDESAEKSESVWRELRKKPSK